MSNEYTEIWDIKVKVKLQVHINTIILIDVYYLKSSKNIIILYKFMDNFFDIVGKGDKIQIIKKNKRFISTSKIKTKNVFVFSLESRKINLIT